jgi:hypothetical protein
MARAMTPAAIRRLGEFALVERTMGKAREYDPASVKPATPEFNPRAYTLEQLDVIEAALRSMLNPPKPQATEPDPGSR